MELVELKPLKPFVGSYRCALADADVIDDMLVEREDGTIVKEKVPRKRFVGLIAVTRRLTPDEIGQFLAGSLDPLIEVVDGATVLAKQKVKPQSIAALELACIVSPEHATVRVPREMADDLVKRGIAAVVAPTRKRGS